MNRLKLRMPRQHDDWVVIGMFVAGFVIGVWVGGGV